MRNTALTLALALLCGTTLTAASCHAPERPYLALTYHDVRVLNGSDCPVVVDLLTSPAAVQFSRDPARLISASNMRAERWQTMDKVAQQGHFGAYWFVNPLFELGANQNTTVRVPHPRYGTEEVTITMACTPVTGSGCEGRGWDSVDLEVDRYDRYPFWEDGKTGELWCYGIEEVEEGDE